MAKVLMLLTNPFRPDPRVHKEAKTLAEAGYNVTVLCWDREGKYPPAENIDGVGIVRVGPRSAFSNFLLFAATLPLFWLKCFRKILGEKWDIVHCNDLDTLPIGVLGARIRGVKVVYDAHEIYSSMIEADVPRSVFRTVEMAEKWFVKKADRTICVNDRFAKMLKEWGAPDPVPVMGCNPLAAVSQEKVNDLRKKLGIESRKAVLYIGVLEPTRKLIELVDGFSKNGQDGVVFVIGGFGSLQQKITEKAGDGVIFVGEVSPKDVPTYTHMAEVLVAVYDPRFKNNRDSVPNKLFEAMSGGKPIIVAKGTWTGETAERTGCGIAVDYDGDEVFEAIRKLLADKTLYERLASNGKKAFEGEYNWDVMGSRLLKVYDSLM